MPRKTKFDPPPDVPGTFCPNCGEPRTAFRNGHPGLPSPHPYSVPDAHADPFDCIRFLRKELSDLKEGG